mmetsp:Transcript_45272/g.117175  ORF Transcript_45272/g.117175 Transcript_45272/m.117175 type:complete len:202 (+) Transcript_45272:505-1110(+)
MVGSPRKLWSRSMRGSAKWRAASHTSLCMYTMPPMLTTTPAKKLFMLTSGLAGFDTGLVSTFDVVPKLGLAALPPFAALVLTEEVDVEVGALAGAAFKGTDGAVSATFFALSFFTTATTPSSAAGVAAAVAVVAAVLEGATGGGAGAGVEAGLNCLEAGSNIPFGVGREVANSSCSAVSIAFDAVFSSERRTFPSLVFTKK